MTWSKGRQLASMSKSGKQLQFKYDFNGIRSSKTVNGTKTVYTYVGDRLISQKTGSEVINFAYTNSGAPYGFTYNGTPYFYLLNLQGDVIGIYDSTGTVVVKYAYDAWGKLISVTGTLASTVGIKNPIRYRGYYYDTETGLYYLQSRYYDPDTCRFINADSLIIAGDYLQGTNMFAYCLNNPVMYVDPSGYITDTQKMVISIITVIGALCYIEDYAERHNMDINAFSDFLERTTNDDTTLGELADTLMVGVYILEGRDWFSAFLNLKGISGDLRDISNAVMGGANGGGFASAVIDTAINILMDYYNPLMFDEEFNLNLPIHLANAAAGMGIGTFSIELGLAVTAATGGNATAGFVIGTAFYFIASYGWNNISSS